MHLPPVAGAVVVVGNVVPLEDMVVDVDVTVWGEVVAVVVVGEAKQMKFIISI